MSETTKKWNPLPRDPGETPEKSPKRQRTFTRTDALGRSKVPPRGANQDQIQQGGAESAAEGEDARDAGEGDQSGGDVRKDAERGGHGDDHVDGGNNTAAAQSAEEAETEEKAKPKPRYLVDPEDTRTWMRTQCRAALSAVKCRGVKVLKVSPGKDGTGELRDMVHTYWDLSHENRRKMIVAVKASTCADALISSEGGSGEFRRLGVVRLSNVRCALYDIRR